jgi:hypothetical protein
MKAARNIVSAPNDVYPTLLYFHLHPLMSDFDHTSTLFAPPIAAIQRAFRFSTSQLHILLLHVPLLQQSHRFDGSFSRQLYRKQYVLLLVKVARARHGRPSRSGFDELFSHRRSLRRRLKGVISLRRPVQGQGRRREDHVGDGRMVADLGGEDRCAGRQFNLKTGSGEDVDKAESSWANSTCLPMSPSRSRLRNGVHVEPF